MVRRHLLASSVWCEVSRRCNGFDLRLFSCEDVTAWSFKVLGYDWRPGAAMDFGLSSFDH
ncbi:unnamed protein product [Brassica oleracea]